GHALRIDPAAVRAARRHAGLPLPRLSPRRARALRGHHHRGTARTQRAPGRRRGRSRLRAHAGGTGCRAGRTEADPALAAGQHPRRRASGARSQRRALPAPAAQPRGERRVIADWPWALAGGVLIGLSATLLLWLTGRVAGVSGILAGV